jgi:hypothetical protein
MAYDLVIKSGLVVDSRGGAPCATCGWKRRSPNCATLEYRATMIREALNDPPPIDFSQIFLLPDGEARYDHRPDESFDAHAQRLGVSPAEAFIMMSPEKAGKALFNYPFLNPQFEAVEKMLDHPQVVIGLGDSGRPWKGLSTPGLLPVVCCAAPKTLLSAPFPQRGRGSHINSLFKGLR